MENARSMLSDAGLSEDYWVEVVDIACYLVNKSSTLALVAKTLYEAWMVKCPLLHISEYLDVMPLCKFQKKEDINLTVSRRSVSSSGIKMELKDINYGIQLQGLWFIAEM